MSCAFEDCGDPRCEVCSVPRRFAHVPAYTPKTLREAEGVRAAKAPSVPCKARTRRES